jgi:hypothetical protein
MEDNAGFQEKWIRPARSSGIGRLERPRACARFEHFIVKEQTMDLKEIMDAAERGDAKAQNELG